MEKVTELEGAVLGAVWMEQPLTAYAVLSIFEASLTSSLTSSTGAIYPAIRRLRTRGLIQAVRRVGDGRATRELTVTKAGLTALRAWIRDLDAAIGTPSDPLRLRMQFLATLDARARRRWVAEASDRLDKLLPPMDERLAAIDAGSEGDPDGPRAAWERRATQWLKESTVVRRTLLTDLAEELASTPSRT